MVRLFDSDMLDMPISDAAYEGGREKLVVVDPALFDPEKQLSWGQRNKRWRKFSRKAKRQHHVGLSGLQGSMTYGFSWNATVALTGVAYTPSQNASGINKRASFSTNIANSASGGADEVYNFQQGVVAGGSATLDLNGMTDMLQRVKTLARIKGLGIRLLSATDDPTISPAPTLTSVGIVTNIGPEVPSPFNFQAGGSGGTVTLTAAGAVTAVAVGAGGTGYSKSTFFLASPQQAGGSACVFLCTTNASGVISAVTFIAGAGGGGYTSATVPLVAVGQYHVATGGVASYFDVADAGVCLVSATSKNIILKNLDQANAVTFEVGVFGGTS